MKQGEEAITFKHQVRQAVQDVRELGAEDAGTVLLANNNNRPASSHSTAGVGGTRSGAGANAVNTRSISAQQGGGPIPSATVDLGKLSGVSGRSHSHSRKMSGEGEALTPSGGVRSNRSSRSQTDKEGKTRTMSTVVVNEDDEKS